MGPRASCIDGRDCRCGCAFCIGGSDLLSDVRLDSGGDTRPDAECEEGADHPGYGGGGPFEYIEAGLTTAVAAIVDADVYDRSVVTRSRLSRLIKERIPLCDGRQCLSGRVLKFTINEPTFFCQVHPMIPWQDLKHDSFRLEAREACVDGREYRAVPDHMWVSVAPVHHNICNLPLSSSMVCLCARCGRRLECQKATGGAAGYKDRDCRVNHLKPRLTVPDTGVRGA